MTLFMPVSGVPAAATRVANLEASAQPPETGEGIHWENGFSWRSELCPEFEVIDPCSSPEDYLTDDSTNGGLVFYQPNGYRVRDYLSTLNVGYDLARVTRQAEAVGSMAAAAELWTGAVTKANTFELPASLDLKVLNPGTAPNYTNPYLAGSTATTLTGVSDPMEALGTLEEKARQQLGGMQCFLHVPVRIATQLGAQIRRVGPLLMTQTDAVIVADPGYPGTGPDGTDPAAPGVWCYATGPVMLRYGSIQTTELPVSATVNRRTNIREVWADRMFAATFDPCCHFAIQVDAAS
jgi:hypothetical protein